MLALPSLAQQPVAVGEDLFDFGHGLRFARHLESQNRGAEALYELKRIDGLNPGILEVRMDILRLYAMEGSPVEGIVAYQRWDYHPYLVPAELRRRYIGLHFQGRALDRLELQLRDGLGLREPEKTRVQLHLALYRHDWLAAQGLFERFEIQHVRRHLAAYAPIMAAVDRVHFRKPWLGALLSVVPGGGQIYSGQWADGLGSLVMVGITGYESYRLLHAKGPRNVLGWALAGLSCSFYIANLSGGRRAAIRYNARFDARIDQTLDSLTAHDF